jgi:hypothetical protein
VQRAKPGSCLRNRQMFPLQNARAARWYIFRPKIPIWVNFGGPGHGKCRYILRPSGIFCDHLVIKWPFGIFSPVLVHCFTKNLATLQSARWPFQTHRTWLWGRSCLHFLRMKANAEKPSRAIKKLDWRKKMSVAWIRPRVTKLVESFTLVSVLKFTEVAKNFWLLVFTVPVMYSFWH